MAGILSSPQLAQITLFGEALQPGRGGVIAVLLVVALMCWIERKFRAVLPESLELILNPLLTTLITGTIAIVALQPLGGWISESIAHGASGRLIAAVSGRRGAGGNVSAAGADRPASGAGADSRGTGAGAWL